MQAAPGCNQHSRKAPGPSTALPAGEAALQACSQRCIGSAAHPALLLCPFPHSYTGAYRMHAGGKITHWKQEAAFPRGSNLC